ncbi:surfeit locus protein 2-like [Scleropages formosus]|uniref:Surfeit locus protein 2-like n=1 Tax=Scleropages formosus TaxID=113540 RepID=A0A0P7UHN0_SCLFO|nr:surfeit locus protein 2-like [Scleropages formosus]
MAQLYISRRTDTCLTTPEKKRDFRLTPPCGGWWITDKHEARGVRSSARTGTMEEIPSEVKAFLQEHPFLQLTEAKKVKCALNGHELPLNLAELKIFTAGKKYQRLSSIAEFDYSQFEPHVVPSTKQPNQLFCKLTLRHINRLPHHVLRHVNGKRYQRALQKYKECEEQGTVFVPARLKQKKPRNSGGEDKGMRPKRGNEFWAPSSSEGENSDSGDSMSDLYPSSMFALKKPSEAEVMEADGSDDFQTDNDEEQEKATQMEVDRQVTQKRKKVGFSFV